MRRLFNIYGLYDNGVLVFKGNRNDIMKKYNLGKSSIYTYLRDGTRVNGKYNVKVIGKDYFETNPDAPSRKPKEKPKPWALETHYDYLEWHLKNYGNTICCFDPEPYIKDLKKAGLKCKIKQVYDSAPPIETNRRGRRPKPSYHYYVEVVKHADRKSARV